MRMDSDNPVVFSQLDACLPLLTTNYLSGTDMKESVVMGVFSIDPQTIMIYTSLKKKNNSPATVPQPSVSSPVWCQLGISSQFWHTGRRVLAKPWLCVSPNLLLHQSDMTERQAASEADLQWWRWWGKKTFGVERWGQNGKNQGNEDEEEINVA